MWGRCLSNDRFTSAAPAGAMGCPSVSLDPGRDCPVVGMVLYLGKRVSRGRSANPTRRGRCVDPCSLTDGVRFQLMSGAIVSWESPMLT